MNTALHGTLRPQFGDAPVGSVMPFVGALKNHGPPKNDHADPIEEQVSPPPETHDIEAWGWMLCDGRSLETGKYPELFAAIGNFYGGSDLTFNIPNFRGVFLRGTDLQSGNDPDVGERTKSAKDDTAYSNVGSYQASSMQDHKHNLSVFAAAGQGGGNLLAPKQTPAQTGSIYEDPAASPPIGISAAETRPSNTAVNFIIKFTYGLVPFHA